MYYYYYNIILFNFHVNKNNYCFEVYVTKKTYSLEFLIYYDGYDYFRKKRI